MPRQHDLDTIRTECSRGGSHCSRYRAPRRSISRLPLVLYLLGMLSFAGLLVANRRAWAADWVDSGPGHADLPSAQPQIFGYYLTLWRKWPREALPPELFRAPQRATPSESQVVAPPQPTETGPPAEEDMAPLAPEEGAPTEPQPAERARPTPQPPPEEFEDPIPELPPAIESKQSSWHRKPERQASLRPENPRRLSTGAARTGPARDGAEQWVSTNRADDIADMPPELPLSDDPSHSSQRPREALVPPPVALKLLAPDANREEWMVRQPSSPTDVNAGTPSPKTRSDSHIAATKVAGRPPLCANPLRAGRASISVALREEGVQTATWKADLESPTRTGRTSSNPLRGEPVGVTETLAPPSASGVRTNPLRPRRVGA